MSEELPGVCGALRCLWCTPVSEGHSGVCGALRCLWGTPVSVEHSLQFSSSALHTLVKLQCFISPPFKNMLKYAQHVLLGKVNKGSGFSF